MRDGKRGAYLMSHTGAGFNNQQLMKDVGIMAYMLHKNHGFHSVVVNKKSDAQYPYLEKYLRGLEMDFLPENNLQEQAEYINSHKDEMDLLIIYGAYPQYIPLVNAYKQICPEGKIYLWADMNIGWGSRLPHTDPTYKKFLESCDVIGAGCRSVQKYIATKWRVPVGLVRNGWYNFPGVSFENLFECKENIILTVGRIGSDQKRNEDMLAAFAKVANDLPDWKLKLVGTIEEKFKPYIRDFFTAHPELRGRVTFTGLIEDKTELANEYQRAKIFCLTSTFEGGTPNVTAEALFAGDYIVFSDFDAADEATDGGKCGRVFPVGNVEELAKIFLEVCRDEKLLLEGGRHAVEWARREFDAEHIIARQVYLLYGGDAQ